MSSFRVRKRITVQDRAMNVLAILDGCEFYMIGKTTVFLLNGKRAIVHRMADSRKTVYVTI